MAEAHDLLDPKSMPRSPGVTYQELLDQDTHKVPDVLRMEAPRDMGTNEFSVERYTTAEYHHKEVQHVWKKVWQFTCREEDIPNPGDHYRYDIAGMSFLVLRTESGEIKSYPNACLHRGRQLKTGSTGGFGNSADITCPFHGFSWALDGAFKGAPCEWDFPHIQSDEFALPSLRVDAWGGWVCRRL